MYDHPSLPTVGDTYQLLEIQCHSKLIARRIQRPKKGSKEDGSDDNLEVATTYAYSGMESPLLWLRADPEMEYLAEISMHQPLHMWINQLEKDKDAWQINQLEEDKDAWQINQLEKDKDVVAQLQAIATLCLFPQLQFAIVNALNNCLMDTKVFWRVRVESVFAWQKTATEETDWAGLTHLIKFYKNWRLDQDIGLLRIYFLPTEVIRYILNVLLEILELMLVLIREISLYQKHTVARNLYKSVVAHVLCLIYLISGQMTSAIF